MWYNFGSNSKSGAQSAFIALLIYRVVHRNCHNLVLYSSQSILKLHGCVICHMNGNFVGFWEIFSKIVKNYPMWLNLHFSGKWQNWPARIWNLTLTFEAVRGHYGLKHAILVYSHSNIIFQWFCFCLRLTDI